MDDKIDTAVQWMAAGRKVALATVIATWGSSPRPVGSQLVVDADGAFEGSVSGGCIESTIITEARHAILERQPQLLSLGISDDQAWDSGLACGGSVEIYVEPAWPHRRVFEQLLALREDRQSVCLLTNLENGRKELTGARDVMAGRPDALRKAVDRVISTGKSTRWITGDQRYFLQGFAPEFQLIIIGAVHIAQPLTQMARLAGYNTRIVDPRKAFATKERFPDTVLVPHWPEKALDQISLHSNTAVVVLSHSPRLDDPALVHALRSEAFYIGALGSRKTHAARLERLKKKGFPGLELKRIRSPIGIPIGSATPAEIALSILAEVTRVKRTG